MSLLPVGWFSVLQSIASIGVTLISIGYALIAATRVYGRSRGFTAVGVLAAELFSYFGILLMVTVTMVVVILIGFLGGFLYALLT